TGVVEQVPCCPYEQGDCVRGACCRRRTLKPRGPGGAWTISASRKRQRPEERRSFMHFRQFTMLQLCCVLNLLLPFAKEAAAEPFDVLIRGGTVYDGSSRAPVEADVAIRADKIVAVGKLAGAKANTIVDAKNLAVAPGFI